jgi:hypothetical protein
VNSAEVRLEYGRCGIVQVALIENRVAWLCITRGTRE